MFTFPKITTAKQIQQNYRQIFDEVKKSKQPTIVMTNNKPDVAIIDVKELEKMHVILDVLQSREESKSGKTKLLKGSLSELWHETQND